MKIAVGSDDKTALTDAVLLELNKRQHDVTTFGALHPQATETWLWPKTAHDVAQGVSAGKYQQGILFCWTGTGVSIAANKIPGVRAALCCDATIAEGARRWNDANILIMSLRNTSWPIAEEILQAWFDTKVSTEANDQTCLSYLDSIDRS